VLDGTLTLGKGQCQGAAPATAERGVPEPSWKWAGNPHQVLQAQTEEEVVERPHSPSPQTRFHWHPAHPNTVLARWVLDISSCSSTEPNGEWAAVGALAWGRSAETEMSNRPQPTKRRVAHRELKGWNIQAEENFPSGLLIMWFDNILCIRTKCRH